MEFFASYKNVQLIQAIISFGLVVLIWLVQLIIYPNFQYLSRNQLHKWHQTYTPRITVVVAPLMISQLIVGVYILFFHLNTLTISAIVLIMLNWLITFIYFVPLHVKIDQDNSNQKKLKKLVSANWYRTITWSLVFIIVLTELIT